MDTSRSSDGQSVLDKGIFLWKANSPYFFFRSFIVSLKKADKSEGCLEVMRFCQQRPPYPHKGHLHPSFPEPLIYSRWHACP